MADNVIDLRSDTVTRPSPAMREAMAKAEVGDDVLDGDPTVRRLEETVATLLGKERALFFPSGSMANQCAIWLQTTRGSEMYSDHDSHIVQWELSGAAALSGVQVRTLRGNPVFRAEDLRAAIRPRAADASDPSLVCIENTHAGAGGVVVPIEECRAIANVAREHGIPVHLDGARLWNAHISAGTSLADFAAVADTVMVSFSKGLGAPVGSALAGSEEHIERAHRIRKLLGGAMRQSGILAAGALFGLQRNLARLAEDHAAARQFAAIVDGAGGARVVQPDTNIVMIDLPAANAAEIATIAASNGVMVSDWTPSRIRAVTHLDVSSADAEQAGKRLRGILMENGVA